VPGQLVPAALPDPDAVQAAELVRSPAVRRQLDGGVRLLARVRWRPGCALFPHCDDLGENPARCLAGLAGVERGGGRRGWSRRPFGSNVSNGFPDRSIICF